MDGRFKSSKFNSSMGSKFNVSATNTFIYMATAFISLNGFAVWRLTSLS